MSGDCFQRAVTTAIQYGREFRNVYVVHGLPVGTGGPVKGRRYWHAWVECDLANESSVVGRYPALVIDKYPEAEASSLIVRDVYYRAGQLTEDRVWRFTIDEATSEMAVREHWGPWVDDWEGYEG